MFLNFYGILSEKETAFRAINRRFIFFLAILRICCVFFFVLVKQEIYSALTFIVIVFKIAHHKSTILTIFIHYIRYIKRYLLVSRISCVCFSCFRFIVKATHTSNFTIAKMKANFKRIYLEYFVRAWDNFVVTV